MTSTRSAEVREMILARAAAHWRASHRRGPFRRLFNRLMRFHPPDQLRVTEHAWDGESRTLGEPALRFWVVDGQGVRPAEDPGPPEPALRGMYFTVGRVRFGIASGGGQVLWGEALGPRAGIGLRLTVSGEGGDLRVVASELLWRS